MKLLRELFKSRTREQLEETVHTVQERTEHFRHHIHNINERLNLIEKRIDRLIEVLDKK